MIKTIAASDITKDFLKEYDGRLVWMRDDYLIMRNMIEDKNEFEILEKVEKIKSEMRREGHIFKA